MKKFLFASLVMAFFATTTFATYTPTTQDLQLVEKITALILKQPLSKQKLLVTKISNIQDATKSEKVKTLLPYILAPLIAHIATSETPQDNPQTKDTNSTVIFDSCGDSSKYKSQTRYPNMEKLLLGKQGGIAYKEGILTDHYEGKLDFCYAKNRNQLIINVPYFINQNEDGCTNGDGKLGKCIDELNIFSYNTVENTLSQATRNPNQIIYKYKGDPSNINSHIMHYFNDYYNGYQNADIASIIFGFGKREGKNIVMESGYGDAGCRSRTTWHYNYESNQISIAKQEGGCVEE